MRSPRGPALASLVLALCAVSAVLVASARAGELLRPPPGTPDPRLMVLTSADLGGAKVSQQGYYKDRSFPSVISYSREFKASVVGSTALLDVDSEAEIGTSEASTTIFFSTVRRVLGTKKNRASLEKQLVREFAGTGGLVSNPQAGRPRNIGVGAASFDLLISFRLLSLHTELHFTVFRVERVLGALVTLGSPGKRVPLSTIRRLAKVMADRMTAQLVPLSVAPPTISGTAQAAQTLTASPGTWSGASATFTYQWQRCDATGANCVDIVGATGQTYVVADTDVGSTISVTVTATNTLGSATAQSVPTAVVVAAPAPP